MTSSKCVTAILLFAALSVLAGLLSSAAADSSASPVPAVNATDGLALKGYDPVAYFIGGQPTKGADQYSFQWKGVTYRFASAENLQRFRTDPEKYLPQYGGYCAYAMSIDRIAERFGHLAAIREALLLRDDVPAATRQTLVIKLSETLADFVSGRAWLDVDHAERIARDACEKATVTIAAATPESELRPLIRHLCASGQLNAGLILRALLSGNIVLFEEALAELADMPVARVSGLIHDRGGVGLRALLEKARLPPSTFPALKEAIEALREGMLHEPGGATHLKRRMVERVLTRCEDADIGEDGARMMKAADQVLAVGQVHTGFAADA